MSGEGFLGLSSTIWIIFAGALVTYATRFGGYLIISRFKTLHPKVSVALNAVPAAVIASLVAPALVQHGLAEIITLVIAGFAGLRMSLVPMLLVGWVLIVALRTIGI